MFALISGISGERFTKMDEPMAAHTSFNIGGPADIFVTPESIDQLTALLNLCRTNEIPHIVIGRGTNLLVRDKGIRGVVICTFGQLKRFTVKDTKIEAEAGALLSAAANAAQENELTGFEFASGIPGTIGGAVVMNAGAYGGQMDAVVFETMAVNENGEIIRLSNAEHGFGYRESVFQKNGAIILKTIIELKKGDKDEIKAKMDEYNSRRKRTQPLNLPSCGSTFRRAEGCYTGKLIEEAGLKGFQIGGAQVSEKHGGFIVNRGGAAAKDVLQLIKHVQEKIYEVAGVNLVPEVKVNRKNKKIKRRVCSENINRNRSFRRGQEPCGKDARRPWLLLC